MLEGANSGRAVQVCSGNNHSNTCPGCDYVNAATKTAAHWPRCMPYGDGRCVLIAQPGWHDLSPGRQEQAAVTLLRGRLNRPLGGVTEQANSCTLCKENRVTASLSNRAACTLAMVAQCTHLRGHDAKLRMSQSELARSGRQRDRQQFSAQANKVPVEARQESSTGEPRGWGWGGRPRRAREPFHESRQPVAVHLFSHSPITSREGAVPGMCAASQWPSICFPTHQSPVGKGPCQACAPPACPHSVPPSPDCIEWEHKGVRKLVHRNKLH